VIKEVINSRDTEMESEVLLNNYLKSIGDELLEVERKTPPEVHQVRLFLLTPPEWAVVVEDLGGGLYTVVPLTSYIQLAITNIYPPVVEWKTHRFIPLPFWVYAREEILTRYTKPVFKIKEIEKIKEYVKIARTKNIGKTRERFIEKVAQRFSDINLTSILYDVVKSEIEQRPVIIQFPESLKEDLERRKELLLAARSSGCVKGENWLGVVEKSTLTLYLPEGYVGRTIRISFKGKVLYEGIGAEKVKIENLPELPSYDFFEEGLSVQVLGD